MKVMVIVKATKSSEAGEMPSEELLTAMGQYNEELVKAGIMLAGEGLHPSSRGARVRFVGSDRIVIDGPFAETKELIAGFWLWRVESLAEAIEWVKRCPNPMQEESEIEVRPVFEAADFGEVFTQDLREQEASLRAVTLGLNPPRFEECPQRSIVGILQSYTMENRTAIPQQWSLFIKHASSLPTDAQTAYYGVSRNGNPKGHFDYLTGVEVRETYETSDPFTKITLPQRRYAIFPHTSHVSKIPNTFETLFKEWIPDCGLSIANDAWLERYSPEFDATTGMGGMEIWIPMEKSDA